MNIKRALRIGSKIIQGVVGQVLFIGTGGKLGQDSNFFWDNTNKRLGIGTTTPTEKVNLLGNTGGTFLKVHDNRSNTGDLAGIKLGTMPSPIGSAYAKTMLAHIETGSYGVGDLVFAINSTGDDSEVTIGSEKMRLTSAGKLGIGTSSPTNILSINGSMDADSATMSGTVKGDIFSGISSSSNSHIEAASPDTHPEGLYVHIPYINNDIAFLVAKGGSISDNQSSSQFNLAKILNGKPDYFILNTATLVDNEYIVEAIFDKNYNYGSFVGISFGATSWGARSVKIEVYSNTAASYVTAFETTTHDGRNINIRYGSDANGISKIKITCSDFISPGSTSGLRIAQIWLLNYNSPGVSGTHLNIGGGDLYGLLTPYASSAVDLGSTSKLFKDIFSSSVVSPLLTLSALGESISTTEAGKIDISGRGNTRITGDNNNNDSSTAEMFGVYQGDTTNNLVTVLKSGNVGIGTTTPGAKLDVSSANFDQLRLTRTGENIRYSDFRVGIDGYLVFDLQTASQYFEFRDVGTPKFRLHNNGNSYFNGGNVGIGTTSPTAVLHLKAGVASASGAPLKFTAGVALTTPEVGAVEFHNSRFYITNVGTRRAIDRTSDVKLDTTTVSNTTTETTVFTGLIPANSLSAGNITKLVIFGSIDEAAASDQVTIRVKLGGVTLATVVSPASGISAKCWHIDGMAIVRSLGASGSIAWHIDMNADTGTSEACAVSTVDTTAAENVTVTAQWNAAKAGNIFTCTGGFMEYKN